MDDESRELVQTFLADAPAFFEPTARKYAAQSIVKGLGKIKDLFGP
jgi:hypothetical protein